jgi:4'-phosphopantetheinyl transferase
MVDVPTQCWCVRLDVDPEPHYATLTEDERSRSARFRFERDRRRYIVARGVLRELLGRALGTEASRLRFVYNAFGKPALSRSSLKFNVSHSADLALVAITTGREIGVDIEYLRPERDYAEIARCDPRTFFEAWTKREAYIKARGEGLADDPVEFAPGWSIHTFEPAPGYIGALAIEAPHLASRFSLHRLASHACGHGCCRADPLRSTPERRASTPLGTAVLG